MQFRLDRFYRINRKALIWVAILGLVYLLSDFFALVFVTFLLVSFTLPVIDYFNKHTRLPRRLIASVLYAAILGGLIFLTYYAVTKVTVEAMDVANNVPAYKKRIVDMSETMRAKYEAFRPMYDRVEGEFKKYLDEAGKKIAPLAQTATASVLKVVTTALLSWLFAFLVVLDLSRLTEELRRFERSRLHDLYEEVAEPVVRFFSVIAKSFRAQAVIAVCNTVLTVGGYSLLGLPKIGLLAVIVFFLSFVPVLGVFLSTAPAVLVALNIPDRGVGAALGVVVLVCVIHALEAYVLNPVIYGRHLKLNPVVVLLILYVGHHSFGVWGVLLGVPVTYYFLTYVFNVPQDEAEMRAALKQTVRSRSRTRMPKVPESAVPKANTAPVAAE